MDGLPLAVSTVTVSLNVTVTAISSPAAHVPSASGAIATPVTTGATSKAVSASAPAPPRMVPPLRLRLFPITRMPAAAPSSSAVTV